MASHLLVTLSTRRRSILGSLNLNMLHRLRVVRGVRVAVPVVVLLRVTGHPLIEECHLEVVLSVTLDCGVTVYLLTGVFFGIRHSDDFLAGSIAGRG